MYFWKILAFVNWKECSFGKQKSFHMGILPSTCKQYVCTGWCIVTWSMQGFFGWMVGFFLSEHQLNFFMDYPMYCVLDTRSNYFSVFLPPVISQLKFYIQFPSAHFYEVDRLEIVQGRGARMTVVSKNMTFEGRFKGQSLFSLQKQSLLVAW